MRDRQQEAQQRPAADASGPASVVGGSPAAPIGPPPPRPSPEQMLVHFYRAVVAHADVWRQRMDATTNWAAATTAGMITFGFGADAPHFILLIALIFDSIFLLMEARRYQMYDLWRRRFRTMNRYLVAPTLAPQLAPGPEIIRAELEALATDLGHTVPQLSRLDAIGYRIHRNYGFLFGIVLLSWALKLDTHPDAARSLQEFVARAQIGVLSGTAVLALVGAFVLAAAGLAFHAPSEWIQNWEPHPPLIRRWTRRFKR